MGGQLLGLRNGLDYSSAPDLMSLGTTSGSMVPLDVLLNELGLNLYLSPNSLRLSSQSSTSVACWVSQGQYKLHVLLVSNIPKRNSYLSISSL